MIDIKIGPMTLVYLQEIVCVVEIGDLVDTNLLAVARKEHRIISLIGTPYVSYSVQWKDYTNTDGSRHNFQKNSGIYTLTMIITMLYVCIVRTYI